jgi:hypothetical protein
MTASDTDTATFPLDVPYVIAVHSGDKDLPLMVVDEQSSNHDGYLAVTQPRPLSASLWGDSRADFKKVLQVRAEKSGRERKLAGSGSGLKSKYSTTEAAAVNQNRYSHSPFQSLRADGYIYR